MTIKRATIGLLLCLFTATSFAGAWPPDDVARDKLDNPENDTVAEAWPQLYAALGRLKDIISARGSANGVASLDATSKIPLAQLPTTAGGVQTNDSDLTCLAGLSTTGVLARTGAGTCATRTIGVGAGMSVTNADGVAGNPAISLSANLQTWNSKAPPTGVVVGTTDTQTLAGKTYASPILSGTVTGTYTLGGTPTFPATVVLTTGGQTISGKTITGGTVSGLNTDIALADGGTGASDPTTARTNLGLGSIATVNSPVPIANGGTGQTSRIAGLQALGIYSGIVNSDGSAISLPAGWSSSRNSSGDYTVTHNLAQAGYVVVGSVQVGGSTDERIFNVYSRGTNSFSYKSRGGAGGLADEVVHFVLYDY